ncbi:hypothetical protein A9P82_08490 [Arachidicoccus ginsenosidimutans]|nr:hypothetical protein A9P82_08420 [Arachidicoccus sp. BS20]ANI89326.1 hypothetical protein A9P82_08490 [Arachidicoccus sp. BS20]
MKHGLCGSLAFANVPHEAKASGKKICEQGGKTAGQQLGWVCAFACCKPCRAWAGLNRSA